MRGALRAGIAGPLSGLLVACNSVLGIHEASPEPLDAESVGDAAPGAVTSYALDCDAYCSVIEGRCRAASLGDDTEYLSPGICGQICPFFESTATANGMVDLTPQPVHSDTLNCRVWHANAAAHTPHLHCPHAGPLGGDHCNESQLGGPCNPFCTLNLAFCTGDAAAYASLPDCMNACLPDAGGYAGFPYQESPTDVEVHDLQTTGNTLNCRMYHLENYLLTGASVHCSHTTQSGGGVCSGP